MSGTLCLFLLAAGFAQAQQDSTSLPVYSLDLVDDLLGGAQGSAASPLKVETLEVGTTIGNSLFSVDVLTAEDLRRWGVMSVPEALGLLPGVLVKQLSTGMYEVHLQTDHGLYSTNNPAVTQNAPFLLMIDFEPADMAYKHTIAWETLPVGITEIRQIEVFRSGQPTYYGTQAVSGLIHIIRNKQTGQRKASVRVGSHRSTQIDLSLPLDLTNNLKMVVGGHFSYADKVENRLYFWQPQQYIAADSALIYQLNAEETNLYSGQSLRSTGGSLMFSYRPKQDLHFALATNLNFSETNLPWLYIDQISETRRKTSQYAATFNMQMRKLSARLRYRFQNLYLAEGYGGFTFNTQTLGLNVAYDLAISEKITLRPYLDILEDNYRPTKGDKNERPYGFAFRNGEAENRFNLAAGANLLAYLSEKLKFSAGLRLGKSSLSNQLLLSMQAASFYDLGNKKILRIALSRSSIMPTLEAWQLNRSFKDQKGEVRNFLGNSTLKVPTVSTINLGFGVPVGKAASVKLEGFYGLTTNPIVNEFISENDSTQTFKMANAKGNYSFVGSTLSARLKIGSTLLRAYLSWQKRIISAGLKNMGKPTYAPTLFGGIRSSSNVFSQKTLLSANLYFGTEQQMQIPFWAGPVKIGPHLSARFAYKVWQESSIFVEAKDLGATSYQNPFGSKISPRYLIGGFLLF